MKRIALFVSTLLCLLMLPAAAFAATNPLQLACSEYGNAGSGSTACGTTGKDPISGSNGVLEKVTIILAGIGSVTAVIIIIISALTIVTSGGDSNRVSSARSAIIGALIGLLLIGVAASIVTFVVSKIG